MSYCFVFLNVYHVPSESGFPLLGSCRLCVGDGCCLACFNHCNSSIERLLRPKNGVTVSKNPLSYMRGTPSTFMIHREPVFMQDPKYMVTDMIMIILLAVFISVCIYSFQVLFCGKYADHVGICNRGFLLRSSKGWLSSDLGISKNLRIHKSIDS